MLSGGGTGGHITPIRSVAHKIKQHQPDATVIYVGERQGAFAHLLEDNPDVDRTYQIFAGKFRRYHGETFLQSLRDVRTIALNLRDALYTTFGIVQALYILLRIRPDAVFLKGGYVGVPIGLIASLLRIPFMTHDSDAVPGLANRLVSRWATLHATALNPSLYPSYASNKTVQTGVIVSDAFAFVDITKRRDFRKKLSIPNDAVVLFVTGGSTGALRINQAVAKLAPELLENHDNLYILHQTGKGKGSVYGGFKHERLSVLEFLDELHVYSGAADVIITRAGANTLAEFGCQGKACIVIPSPHLAGGHQLKNAQHLAEIGAVSVVDQQDIKDDQDVLVQEIETLITSEEARLKLASRLHKTAVLDAADRIAKHLLTINSAEQSTVKRV